MMSHHAMVRCQQRGIEKEVVDVLLRHGRRRYRHGASVCFMDKPSRYAARCELGDARFSRIADRLDAYAVVSDEGRVITVAKRTKRLKF